MRTKTEPSANGTVARQVTQYDYNARGQLTKTTLPDTTETQNEYWPNGALKKTYGSQTYAVDYTYDPQGRMRTMTTTGQAGAAVTTWNYDPARGWLKTKVYADGKGPEYTYTPAGRLATRKWARGIMTTYNYTAGDLTGIDYSDTTPDVTYVYNRRGLRDTVTDASGTRNIAYNVAGEIATETYTAGLMNGLSVERTFDSLLRRDGLTLKNGSTVLHGETLGYGEASRLDHIILGTERVEYGYEPNSALVHTVTFKHNGTTVMTTTKDYDFVNQLTEIKSVTGSTTVSRYAYDYNALNQRSKATLADNGYWSYDYNARGEVINGTRKDANATPLSGQNFGYEFDGIGNRLTTSIDGATESSYTANAVNQYTAINSVSPTYDDDGNLINDGSKKLAYNGENRLVEVKDLNNTLIATYTYDDEGRRMRKVTTAQAPQGTQDKVFLWDGGICWLNSAISRQQTLTSSHRPTLGVSM